MKNLVTLLMLFCITPVYAGVYEDAMKGDKDVLLYLYTPYCKACNVMQPYFDDVIKSHKELNGVKVNADTFYGMSLMRKFKGRYVPYIVFSSPRTGKSVSINYSCVMDDVCMERALKGLKG